MWRHNSLPFKSGQTNQESRSKLRQLVPIGTQSQKKPFDNSALRTLLEIPLVTVRDSFSPLQSRKTGLVLAIFKWQESVLAIFKGCRHRLKHQVMGSGKNQFLPFFKWQEPVLVIFKGCRQRLKHEVMGSGKTQFLPLSSGKNRFLPFPSGKNQFLPYEVMGSGKNQFLPFSKGVDTA